MFWFLVFLGLGIWAGYKIAEEERVYDLRDIAKYVLSGAAISIVIWLLLRLVWGWLVTPIFEPEYDKDYPYTIVATQKDKYLVRTYDGEGKVEGCNFTIITEDGEHDFINASCSCIEFMPLDSTRPYAHIDDGLFDRGYILYISKEHILDYNLTDTDSDELETEIQQD